MRRSRKIFVFINQVITLMIIFGSLMHVIEDPDHGFISIPTSMYWEVVTTATVGFGNVAPATSWGSLITSILILIGSSIIAVRTGIHAAELANNLLRPADGLCASHSMSARA